MLACKSQIVVDRALPYAGDAFTGAFAYFSAAVSALTMMTTVVEEVVVGPLVESTGCWGGPGV